MKNLIKALHIVSDLFGQSTMSDLITIFYKKDLNPEEFVNIARNCVIDRKAKQYRVEILRMFENEEDTVQKKLKKIRNDFETIGFSFRSCSVLAPNYNCPSIFEGINNEEKLLGFKRFLTSEIEEYKEFLELLRFIPLKNWIGNSLKERDLLFVSHNKIGKIKKRFEW